MLRHTVYSACTGTQNLKAARRSGDRNLGFGTHPEVIIAGNDHSKVPLLGVSPPTAVTSMIPVSSSCNLSCSYCYADRGAFKGAQSQRMSREVAIQAVDRLLTGADPSRPVTIGFLGGEPLLNRDLIHDIVRHAGSSGARRGLDVRFSITTNGTLLGHGDILLLREHRFAVTVSIDGDPAVHDLQRPGRGDDGSFMRLRKRITPLLINPGWAKVAARVTVRPDIMRLSERLEAIWAMGFSEAGVSPLRASPDGRAFRDPDWPRYLTELIGVSRVELERVRTGRAIRLTNLAVALKQIHRGASAPYACGAGGGYFSVAADGRWYACHRAVGDETYVLGDATGLDVPKRRQFLDRRHVHAQTECRSCWARYLCSGGCHQEAQEQSARSCDFIRNWLEYCLASYCELSSARPEFFAAETGQ